MDVLIHASKETIAHKLRKNIRDSLDDILLCWWRVNGIPRKTQHGDKIMFSDGEKVHAEGEILSVGDGAIEFTPLNEVDYPQPKKPPTRGFTYVDSSK